MGAPKMRGYQSAMEAELQTGWQTRDNVLLVLSTGGGKTVIFSNVVAKHNGAASLVAHREELVAQISQTLARVGVRHGIVAPKSVIKRCIESHIKDPSVGRSMYDGNAQVRVASVDTLKARNGTGDDGDYYYQKLPDGRTLEYGPRQQGVWGKPRVFEGERPPRNQPSGKSPPTNRRDELIEWLNRVTLWVMDEAHHVLTENKWGIVTRMFPNAKGLGVTATPERADGKGLGSHADGVFDMMIVGPPMRQLIDDGYLLDYRVIAKPATGLDLRGVELGSNRDYKQKQLDKAMAKSQIVGNVVETYLKYAKGLKGVTFAANLTNGQQMVDEFNASGVKAVLLHADSDKVQRREAGANLASGAILMVVNVDLLGEGYDLPSIQVAIFARPTKSYGLYVQQFGRPLRLDITREQQANWENYTPEQRKAIIAQSPTPQALIIDHVGNIGTLENPNHGLPDASRMWSLDRREKRGSSGINDSIPTTSCLNAECGAVYERVHPQCPYCGHENPPAERGSPEQVDGDLAELDPDVLAQMRLAVAKAEQPVSSYAQELAATGLPRSYVLAQCKHFTKSQDAQKDLQHAMTWWAGLHEARGSDQREQQRRFYHTFGVDVANARLLKAKDAEKLRGRVLEAFQRELTTGGISPNITGSTTTYTVMAG